MKTEILIFWMKHEKMRISTFYYLLQETGEQRTGGDDDEDCRKT